VHDPEGVSCTIVRIIPSRFNSPSSKPVFSWNHFTILSRIDSRSLSLPGPRPDLSRSFFFSCRCNRPPSERKDPRHARPLSRIANHEFFHVPNDETLPPPGTLADTYAVCFSRILTPLQLLNIDSSYCCLVGCLCFFSLCVFFLFGVFFLLEPARKSSPAFPPPTQAPFCSL